MKFKWNFLPPLKLTQDQFAFRWRNILTHQSPIKTWPSYVWQIAFLVSGPDENDRKTAINWHDIPKDLLWDELGQCYVQCQLLKTIRAQYNFGRYLSLSSFIFYIQSVTKCCHSSIIIFLRLFFLLLSQILIILCPNNYDILLAQ